MARQLSEAAKAAKIIRAELKKNGINAKVRSKNYSGGSSITVIAQDLLPAVKDEINSYLSQFEYGSFNGMIDCYEMNNRRHDIPQVTYTFLDHKYSDELLAAAWEWGKSECDLLISDSYENADYQEKHIFTSMIEKNRNEFWRAYKPRKAA